MLPLRFRILAATLVAVPLAPSAVWADYVSQTYFMDHGGEVTGATAQVETYDGNGAQGGGLGAGQARITVRGSIYGAGQPIPEYPGTILEYNGVNIQFLTDLNLQPNQFSAPPNWTIGATAVQPGEYQVRATNFADLMTHTDVSLLISGLGANATESHFLLGRRYED